LALPAVEGLPRGITEDVVVLPFNDTQAAQRLLEENRDDLAAVIVEPILGSAGMIPANQDYLEMLRSTTSHLGALLIFDEVISFRIAPGGAQEYYGITPDLTCLGKFIGGGFPIGAFGGREDIMALFDPTHGPPRIAHGGSFNANPMTMVAGAVTLEQLTPRVYQRLNSLGQSLRDKAASLFQELEVAAQVTGAGSLFGIFFTPHPITSYREAARSDTELRHRVFLGLLNEGVLMDPRGAGCLSTPMSEAEIDIFIEAMRRVLRRVCR
jgi:glutamate-1-semialdehyde 2,1-aminomutase